MRLTCNSKKSLIICFIQVSQWVMMVWTTIIPDTLKLKQLTWIQSSVSLLFRSVLFLQASQNVFSEKSLTYIWMFQKKQYILLAFKMINKIYEWVWDWPWLHSSICRPLNKLHGLWHLWIWQNSHNLWATNIKHEQIKCFSIMFCV